MYNYARNQEKACITMHETGKGENKMKKFTTMISILVLCTIMLGMLTGCGSAKSEPASDVAVPDWVNSLSDEGVAAAKEIISKGKLVLGTSADYAPFEFHTEINGTDTIVGFDVSIAQYMAEQLGVELEIVDMSFDNLLISLNKGDFDVVLAAMSSNEERAKAVDFSSEYYFSNNVILVQKQNADKYSTKESLQGVSMAAQKGTVCENRAKELAGEASVVSLVKVQDMVSELLAGKVETVLLDKPVASGYVIMQDSLEMVDIGLVAEEGMSVAMKKDSAGLGELVNYLLSQLTEEQLDSWMGEAQVTAGVEE